MDAFDAARPVKAGDYLSRFPIPQAIRRAYRLPLPFKPVDNVHATDFTPGSRDEHEARHWYLSLAWLEQLNNDTNRDIHSRIRTPTEHADVLVYTASCARRVYSIGAARYDYLSMRQTEPALAEAYAHADAIPRNGRRGDGAHRIIAGVVRPEAYASSKLGAIERGFSYCGGRGGSSSSRPTTSREPRSSDSPAGARPRPTPRAGGTPRGGGRGGRGAGGRA